MTIQNTLKTAIGGLAAHKLRSALTILGIVIGVAAIIIVMTLGEGANNLIVGEISAMGADTIFVIPGGNGLDPESAIFAEGLTQKDFEALKRPANVPNLKQIVPGVLVSGKIEYRDTTYSRAQVLGTSAELFGEIMKVTPGEGYAFPDTDIQARSRVIVIGKNIKEELFGESQAIGENISIRGTQFRVVGVYPDTGQRGLFNIDDLAVVPYTTAQNLMSKNDFDRLIIKIDDAANSKKAEFDINATLRESRGFDVDDEIDFSVITQEALIEQISQIIGILTAFLAMVVAIALIVGGIGIMNIMLVSVTERTREIGLRKAVGATQKTILQQFLFEAVILTSLGGLIGIILGAAVSFVASIILAQTVAAGWTFSFAWGAAGIGLGVSAAVGLVFGIYPAYQASLKSPIEALRYE